MHVTLCSSARLLLILRTLTSSARAQISPRSARTHLSDAPLVNMVHAEALDSMVLQDLALAIIDIT